MYTYVQRPGCKKENMATYVYTGGVSNAYSRIRTARARVHGWVGTEKQRLHHVHGEATECVLFIRRQRNACCSSGANRLGRNTRLKQGLAYRRTEEMALCSTSHGGNRILFIGRGLAYHKMEETDFCWTSYGQNRVPLTGRGVAYHKTEETDLCWNATVEMGVLFIGRGVAYRKTGLHGILFISTVDLLQPPRATVHPPSPFSSLHPRLFIHRLLFIQPPPRATPAATVQPARHGVVLFIQPSTGSCSSSPNRLTVHPPPRNAHCSSRGNTDRLQLAAVAKESLDWV